MITALTVFLWSKYYEEGEEMRGLTALVSTISLLLALTQDITLILFIHSLTL